MSHSKSFEVLSKSKAKFIKSLGLKKYRLQENAFIVEGAKNIQQLLAADYEVRMVVGTPDFLLSCSALIAKRTQAVFQVDRKTLACLGAFQSNYTALAVATIKPNKPVAVTEQEYGLVLDNIQDPGNLGAILRIAAWYGMQAIICSMHTVDLYNPKVLHASMGAFTHVQVYYADLATYLSQAKVPIIGTFTTGENLHHAALPVGGLVVIGNETKGIRAALMPYMQQQISIPGYGSTESLNAAMATAVVCDNLRRLCPRLSS